MRALSRRFLVAAASISLSVPVVQAQVRVEEIRVDVARLGIAGSRSAADVGVPGSVALALYLNDKLALEPTLGVRYVDPENAEGTATVSLGVFAPYYFAGDRGRSGLFVAPGLMISKATEEDLAIDLGAEVGVKKAISPKVSWAFAGTILAGDSYDPDVLLGARLGLSVFWR